MLISSRQPASKINTAIQLLQHLAAAAAQAGEPCADPLFQAADFLQDALDIAHDLDDPDTGSSGMAAFDTLMNRLADVLPGASHAAHA
jgi:hypothetical protein